jgi:hypothetical protein
MKEPKGTRIQVVQGFADLTWNFLNEHLGQPMEKQPRSKYYRPRRHQIECHSPKWEDDHWTCCYILDEHAGKPYYRPLAIIKFWPDGTVELTLSTRDAKAVGCFTHKLVPPDDILKGEEIRAWFWGFADSEYGIKLAAHLVEQTTLRKGSKPLPL